MSKTEIGMLIAVLGPAVFVVGAWMVWTLTGWLA